MSLADASILSGFKLEDRCQNKGSVVDIRLYPGSRFGAVARRMEGVVVYHANIFQIPENITLINFTYQLTKLLGSVPVLHMGLGQMHWGSKIKCNR
jgi:hypothetical protein